VSPIWRWFGWLALLALLVGGSYGSAFFSRKLFLEEFNAMNHFYKQTLFLTGKNERDSAVANWEKMASGYAVFQRKYSAYQPYALRGDRQLVSDLQQVAVTMAAVEPLVRDGDLHQAHLDLEKIRPMFQDIFKRNGFSMLAVALVDFHDAMELILDAANAKEAEKVKQLHPMLSDKFKPVELEANDAEIQAIRKNLDELLTLAQAGNLGAMPAQADQLKSSFVKVYLKRG
jgi:soluble cytochrome b562